MCRVDADLQILVSALDECVPRDDAWVLFVQHGGGPDESKIAGNRTGYQRLGIEFLKATVRDDATECFNVDLDYLVSEESTVGFDWFELADAPVDVQSTPTWLDRLLPVGCLISAVFIATMFCVGVATTIRWVAT